MPIDCPGHVCRLNSGLGLHQWGGLEAVLCSPYLCHSTSYSHAHIGQWITSLMHRGPKACSTCWQLPIVHNANISLRRMGAIFWPHCLLLVCLFPLWMLNYSGTARQRERFNRVQMDGRKGIMNGWIDMVLRKHSSLLNNLCTQTQFQVVTLSKVCLQS